MSAAKKQKSAFVSSRLRGLFAWLLGPGRPALVVMVLVAVFAGGWFLAWQRLKARILAGPEYRVGPEQVEITPPPPPWVHSDVRAEAFRDPALDGPLWLMDDDLVDRIKKAFSERPWVAKVVRVSKRHPASVQVELVYRQPVCMVEVPGGVVAVDAEGVVLPSKENFSPLEATRYPQLVRIDRGPIGPAGTRWGDARVVGGAEIAAALGPVWDRLGLARIEPLADDPAAGMTRGNNSGGRFTEPVFALFTRNETRILWGYAPGARISGEISAAEKTARLLQYHSEHDSLDGPQGQRQQLDVRKLPKATLPPQSRHLSKKLGETAFLVRSSAGR